MTTDIVKNNQVKEQVIDNTNTGSEAVKNNYVVSDVKSDDEVIFDFYDTSMSKSVSWSIHSEEDETTVESDQLFLNEKDAEKSVDKFKKEPIDYEGVRDEIEDRFYNCYSVHSDEDDNGNFIVDENDTYSSIQKMSVLDYINKEIERHQHSYWFKDYTRTQQENQVITWINNKLKRQVIDYECVRVLKNNKLTFGLIKKVNDNETKKAA